ncbi:MAG TPA: hypothetical protein VFT43_12425 [Candidatus Polarisedimenticolia bacterium]|nr:hypothetical protein [Candidatus Polarisedimenticolia bacterium]
MPTDERPLEALALGALALLIVALTVAPITSNDIFLHLKTGSLVLETGRVPQTDDYSALARGRPFIAHEWLAGVLFRIAEGLFGLDRVVLVKPVVALLVAGALYAAARRLGASPVIALPALAFVMLLAAARFLDRPHIFSYLLTAFFLLLLARRQAGLHTPLWIFLPLQIAWANLHGGFLLGVLVVGLASLAQGIDALARGLAPAAGKAARDGLREARRLGTLACLLVAACLLNPYGARLLRFPFELTGSSFMEAIYEWQPPFQSTFASTYMARYYIAWAAFGAAVLVTALVVALRRREAPPGGSFPLLLFAVFFALSWRMNRNVTDFALATLPGVATGATWIDPRRGRRFPMRLLLPAFALVFLGLAGWFVSHGYSYSPSTGRPFGIGLYSNIPVGGADYIQASGLHGNAFNTYAAGAYLVYRFYPEVRVAMDSRNDVYGEALYNEYTRALTDPDALTALLRRIDAEFVFLDWTVRLQTTEGAAVSPAGTLRQVGGWRLVYFDDNSAVYVRQDGPWAALAARDGYTTLDPSFYSPGRLPPAEAERALDEAGRAEALRRGSYVPRVIRVEALLRLGRLREAAEEEARILEEAPPLHHIYTSLGLVHLAAGDRRAASALFRRALDLNPTSEAALWGLRQSALTN